MSDDRIKIAYGSFYGGLRGKTLPAWDDLPDWIRDAMRVSYFQAMLDKPRQTDNSAHIKRLEAALLSISKNTCCDNCREAANVARAALASYVGLAAELCLPQGRRTICPCCGTGTIIDADGDCSCTKCGWEFTTVVRSGNELKSNPFARGTSSWEAYEVGWRDASKEAAEIIDMLKTVIETELVKLGLPTKATPTSALGRARAFIQGVNR